MPGREKLPSTLKRSSAKALGVPGRSGMDKKELACAIAREQ